VHSAQEAAAVVALGEWIALDSCIARVSGIAVQGSSGRPVYLDADPSCSPAAMGGSGDADELLGAAWLLQLCKQWWQSNTSQLLSPTRKGDA
jgi:hypothetical protein